jgi:cytochrome c peroxidase
MNPARQKLKPFRNAFGYFRSFYLQFAVSLFGLSLTASLVSAEVNMPAGRQDSDRINKEKEFARGEQLFNEAKFGGNGRTCVTCHTEQTGTLSPAQIATRSPKDPIFQHDGADLMGGNTFSRLRSTATFLVEIPLPDNVQIVGSSSRSVLVRRGVPTVDNVPALDPILMWDGREPNLEEQALSAWLNHSQITKLPSVSDRQAVAAYERTQFNREKLQKFATQGTPLQLPTGRTESEKRGRIWLTDDNPVNGNPPRGRCVHCHSGPMLNQFSPGAVALGFPAKLGARFFSAFVSEFNDAGQTPVTFRFTATDSTTTDLTSPDAGRALITGDPKDFNFFKIPTIWGSKDTPPYFHDNSAATLEDLMNHYQKYFRAVFGTNPDAMSDQDKADIIAYLKLL